MADVFDSAARSAVMRAVRSTGTTPAMRVRRAVHALGGRYRLHRKDLPGTPDLVRPRRRLVLFVHGCFWHGHGCARGAREPKTNADYWRAKIARNRARDEAARAALIAGGWRVETLGECETRDATALSERLTRILAGGDESGVSSAPPPG